MADVSNVCDWLHLLNEESRLKSFKPTRAHLVKHCWQNIFIIYYFQERSDFKNSPSAGSTIASKLFHMTFTFPGPHQNQEVSKYRPPSS